MNPNGRRTMLATLVALFLPAVSQPAGAQSEAWPVRPVRIVVPFPPGGGTDVLARMLAERLRPILEQPVVIENRPGATGNIGNELVARAAPDGYTLLMQGTIIGMFPHIFAKLSYDPLKDLVPVAAVAESPNVVVVNQASALTSLDGLVKTARSAPGKPLNYGTAGVGSPQHLAMEQLARLAGVQWQHINYRGTAPAVNDLLAGQTEFGAYSLSSMLPFLQGGKLRALAVLSARRTPLQPDAPSAVELGYPDIDSSIRFALFLPAGVRPEVAAKLADATRRALADAALRENFTKAGYEIVPADGPQVAAMVRREHAQWGPLVREMGLKPE